MSFELAETLRAALDRGYSLAELEASLLARADNDDQLAAGWLFAWAYDAVRPRRDDLAARITSGAPRDRTPARRLTRDPATTASGPAARSPRSHNRPTFKADSTRRRVSQRLTLMPNYPPDTPATAKVTNDR